MKHARSSIVWLPLCGSNFLASTRLVTTLCMCCTIFAWGSHKTITQSYPHIAQQMRTHGHYKHSEDATRIFFFMVCSLLCTCSIGSPNLSIHEKKISKSCSVTDQCQPTLLKWLAAFNSVSAGHWLLSLQSSSFYRHQLCINLQGLNGSLWQFNLNILPDWFFESFLYI